MHQKTRIKLAMGRRATHGGEGESGRGAGGDGLGDGGVGCGGGGTCAVEQVFGVIVLMHARACMLSNGVLLGRHLKYTILSSSVHFLRE